MFSRKCLYCEKITWLGRFCYDCKKFKSLFKELESLKKQKKKMPELYDWQVKKIQEENKEYVDGLRNQTIKKLSTVSKK